MPATAARGNPDWAATALPPAGRRLAPTFYLTPRGKRERVTLLCQDLGTNKPSGAAQAALALAVATANCLRADLRLIATQQAIDPLVLGQRLRDLGLSVHGECILAGPLQGHTRAEYDRFDGELMIAPSTRCAGAVLAELPAADLVCLLHPEDPGLVDAGPGQAGSSALAARTDLRFVICSEEFRGFLVARGFAHLTTCVPVIEPAVSAPTTAQPLRNHRPRTFLFEVLPPVDSRRFAIGLHAIEQALARGALDPQHWDFVFATSALPLVTLACGLRPTLLEHLEPAAAWQARKRADLALVLPSPGLPTPGPFANAAPVVVVATAAAQVADTAATTGGIITCALEPDAIVEALCLALARQIPPVHSGAAPNAAERTDPAAPDLAAVVGQLLRGR